jgi:hypothetical protein
VAFFAPCYRCTAEGYGATAPSIFAELEGFSRPRVVIRCSIRIFPRIAGNRKVTKGNGEVFLGRATWCPFGHFLVIARPTSYQTRRNCSDEKFLEQLEEAAQRIATSAGRLIRSPALFLSGLAKYRARPHSCAKSSRELRKDRASHCKSFSPEPVWGILHRNRRTLQRMVTNVTSGMRRPFLMRRSATFRCLIGSK